MLSPVLQQFTVKRREPELVPPAKPTPRGTKPLSDIDDQESLRFLIDVIQIYPRSRNTDSQKKNPAGVIREALAKTLVFYYPFAGRLREGSGRKLLVDCTGEGLMFVEAEASIKLKDLSVESGFHRPPFPRYEELLFNVPGFGGILNCPLLLIQVTRFRCGGFSMAVRLNHTMSDAAGLVRFLSAVAEMARGASQPSVLPVWGREVLLARDPPRVTCTHKEYEGADGPIFPLYGDDNDNDVVDRSFFFGLREISALRQQLPPDVERCSTYELLAAFLWRCRTIALQLKPSDEVRYLSVVNARSQFNPPLPEGYYGVTFGIPAAISTAGEISTNNLAYTVKLIQKAKLVVTEEYIRSVADFMAIQGRSHFKVANTWIISDNTRFKYLDLDFGFGKPIYGGPATAMVGAVPGPISFFVKATNATGETGVLLLICLPMAAMERFAEEVGRWSSQNTYCRL